MVVSVVFDGYIAKRNLTKRTNCQACKTALNASTSDVRGVDYLSKLSMCGLITHSMSLANYVTKRFAIMDVIELPIKVAEREAAEYILRQNECAKLFVCIDNIHWGEKFANRIVISIFYNNAQKLSAPKCSDRFQRKKTKTQ